MPSEVKLHRRVVGALSRWFARPSAIPKLISTFATKTWTDFLHRQVRHVLENVVQETEFRRAVISTARMDGLKGFQSERAYVIETVMSEASEIAEATSEEREAHFLVRIVVVAASVVGVVAVGPMVQATIESVFFYAGLINYDGFSVLPYTLPARPTIVGVPYMIAVVAGIPCAIVVVRRAARVLYAWDARVTRQWQEAVKDYVRPRIRIALNNYASLTRRSRLLIEEAPSLAEAQRIEHLVPRVAFDAVRMLSRRFGAATIAVAGPRGVGKTTLLRQVCDPRYATKDDDWLRVRVSAPVTYDAREFLIHLFRRLCQAVLSVVPYPERATRGRRLFAAAVRWGVNLVAAAVVVLVAVPVAFQDPYIWWDFALKFDLPGVVVLWPALPDSPLMALLVATTTLLAAHGIKRAVGRRVPRSPRRFTTPAPIAVLAREEERRLRFLQTTSVQRSGSVGASAIGIGHTSSREFAEQPSGLPDLVDSYRGFVAAVAEWWRDLKGVDSGVMIGIDEIDLISDAAEADDFLNNLKSIFGGSECTYIITISDEALATFERRLVTVRNAFDSVFDEVVRVGRMSFDESADMLRRRVIGFPAIFIALCHCMSGGTARDLMRAARAVIRARVDSRRTHLEAIVPIAVANEIETLKRGFLDRLVRNPAGAAGDVLVAELADPGWPGSGTSARLAAVDSLRRRRSDPATTGSMEAEIAGAILLYTTLEEAFQGYESMLTTADDERGPGELTEAGRAIVEVIADARDVLAVSPAIAYSRLVAARAKLGLAPPAEPDGASASTSRQPAARANGLIRQWAMDNGVSLPSRGPIPKSVRQQYEKAHRANP